jgi:hypothetical protein
MPQTPDEVPHGDPNVRKEPVKLSSQKSKF